MDDINSSPKTVKLWNNVKISLHDIQSPLYCNFNLLPTPSLPVQQVLLLVKPSTCHVLWPQWPVWWLCSMWHSFTSLLRLYLTYFSYNYWIASHFQGNSLMHFLTLSSLCHSHFPSYHFRQCKTEIGKRFL